MVESLQFKLHASSATLRRHFTLALLPHRWRCSSPQTHSQPRFSTAAPSLLDVRSSRPSWAGGGAKEIEGSAERAKVNPIKQGRGRQEKKTKRAEGHQRGEENETEEEFNQRGEEKRRGEEEGNESKKMSVEVKEKKTSAEAKEKTEVRLAFLGAAGVGKTALIQRFLGDTFEPKHRRTVEELHCCQYQVGGATVNVKILDTSGSYSFPAMRRLSIQHSDAFALVYAVDDPESLEVVKRLQAEILAVKEDKFTPIVVVGNKIDRRGERRVSSADALATVELNWNRSVLEASAKEDANVVEVFRELLQQARLPSRLGPALRRRRETFPKGASECPPMNKTNSCAVS
ncbi:GTP-binding protein Rhes [Merluccius polli]|uniref:GTP-binding protein Rhes n=1 Tax=Merluccius polli TaxID=89951 RepID=A0AA47M9M8_MERPO|nr:GTP-binding protein Rhes [Merluccius polli]